MIREGYTIYEEKIKDIELKYELEHQNFERPSDAFKNGIPITLWGHGLSIISYFIENNDASTVLNKQRLICFWTTHCLNFLKEGISNIDTDIDIVREEIC